MKRTGLLPLLLLITFTSCQRGVYIPDKVNSPGFKEAGEVKLDLSAKPQIQNGDGSAFSFSSDIAYAPINHLGIIASYRNVNNKVSVEDDFFGSDQRTSKFNGHRADIGLGYFNSFKERGKFEAYGGCGIGNITALIHHEQNGYSGTGYPDESYDARYVRFFLQSALGFDNNVFSLMGGSRLTFQKYNAFESTDASLRYSLVHDATWDVTEQTFGFIEPYIEMQVGFKYIKFSYQFGWACQVAGPSLRYEAGLPYMSFGILLHYARRFRKV